MSVRERWSNVLTSTESFGQGSVGARSCEEYTGICVCLGGCQVTLLVLQNQVLGSVYH
jgi:hypothetical protein